MSNKKTESLVEEALLQMKSIEEAISENAKGILASTMKQEIGELVRESIMGSKMSLQEQEQGDEESQNPENEDEIEVSDEEEVVTQPTDDTDNVEGQTPEGPTEELPPLDMTTAPMADVLKVFKAMGDEDGFIIKKDGDNIHLKDGEANTEYIISLSADDTEQPIEQPIEQMAENTIYELVFEDNSMMDEMNYMEEEEMDEMNYMDEEEMDEMNYMDEEEMDEMNYMDETIYEIDEDSLDNVVESFKAKGRIGKLKTKIYPSKLKHGVTETPEDEISDGWMHEEDGEEEGEKTEASRTLGNGSRNFSGRKGLPKMKVKTNESVTKEMDLLREKNEEYKKALDFFRNKLNEVAIFNSNLAYATRLFTEHSTTKQEKINILRRFDNVESLKESKSLYKSIKDELGDNPSSVVTESIAQKVVKTPSNGSSSNLIESKAYENPQFMRMKDLMNKIK